jgi:ribosome-associated toxin RatA of RatAB toxin-antitoxin module
MKAIKYILVGLVTIVFVAVSIGLFLPSNYQIRQSTLINAPAHTVFNEVNNFQQWNSWSPWQDKDINTHISYEGPSSGVGSKMLWDSQNPKVGKGNQEIIVSIPNKHIQTILKFAGWDSVIKISWDFEEQGNNKTKVTWTFNSQIGKNILYKYMAIIFKPALKRDYIKGLQQLKDHAERIYIAQ